MTFESAEAVGPSLTRPRASGLGRSSLSRLKIYTDLTRELQSCSRPIFRWTQACACWCSRRRTRVWERYLAGRLLAPVTAGQSLSTAIANAGPDAPAVLASPLRAGEARGGLAPTLLDLAAFFENRIEMQGKVRRRHIRLFFASQPGGVIAIVIGAPAPVVMPIFADSGTPPPPPRE